jgi:hypothetical protein
MNAHGPEHEERLAQLLASEGEPTLPVDLLACSECRDQWQELQAAAGGMHGLAAEQRSVLAEARSTRGAVGEDLVAGLVRAGLRARPSGRRHWPWFALAAAVLVALGVWIGRSEPATHSPPQPDIVLGDTFRPTGRGVTELRFLWPDKRRPGESFVLCLLDKDPLEPPREIPCTTNSWTPSDVEAAEMRRRDHWLWRVDYVSSVAGRVSRREGEAKEFSFSR